jgi:hypothetical protein
MTEIEANAYFTESNYPHQGSGETWGDAIKRAYLADVTYAAEMIPRLGPKAVQEVLTAMFQGVGPSRCGFRSRT